MAAPRNLCNTYMLFKSIITDIIEQLFYINESFEASQEEDRTYVSRTSLDVCSIYLLVEIIIYYDITINSTLKQSY